MSYPLITIERFISEQQELFPQASGQFTKLLQDLATAAKLISREIRSAGINTILGETDSTNPSGEKQQQLDLLADKIICQLTFPSGRLCTIASEEHEDLLEIPAEFKKGRYILLIDPLDGSSNIDVNVSIGTIFSIHKKVNPEESCQMDDVLQMGKQLVAAGYIIYGSSTVMVYSTGLGVHSFTLDPSIGEFILTDPKLKIPENPKYYSINHGNERFWTRDTIAYVRWLQGIDGENPNPLTLRYNGSLVSAFHRNLLKGGIYIYPAELNEPLGKIRLMYEAQALAFIAKQAGGYGSDGVCDLLEIEPESLHQRTPIFIGNTELVKRAEAFIADCKTI